MIKTRKELKEFLDLERRLYIKGGYLRELKLRFLHDSDYLIWSFIKSLRYTEYHFNKKNRLRYIIYQRRKNIKGRRLGISIYHNSIDKGLKIHHYGNIIVNKNAKIGKNCELHGDNCIGNKGDFDRFNAPIIGDNLDLGIGAVVIGGIKLGSCITVGANAVVVKDCLTDSSTLVGVPAKCYYKLAD